MFFRDVIGQSQVKSRLVEMVSQNRVSHAIMFLGSEGSGGLSLARAFSQYLFCEKVNKPSHAGHSLFGDEPPAGLPADSCGECVPCKKAAAMMHPDIHFSYPVIPDKPGDKPISADYVSEWREFISANPYGNLYDWLQFIKAENRQGNITSRECEEILRKMSLKSFEAGYKILIMWMPESLGKEGNKLLKLVEEPPADSLFIFVAENESQILPTIMSRVQLVTIPRLSNTEITTALINREGIPESKASRAAMMSDGNFRDAFLSLQEGENDWEGILSEWMKSIVRTGPSAQYKWVESISKLGREQQKQFLLYFNHMISHAVHLRTMGLESSPENTPWDDMATRLNKLCTTEQQLAIVEEIDNSIYYIERNANAKILFHALTIRLYHIISNKSVILVN